MIYDIRHVTRFDYGGAVKFARCNLRLKPIIWSGQTLERYRLTIAPSGRTYPARAEAGLANVTRLVIEEPVRQLTIERAARITGDVEYETIAIEISEFDNETGAKFLKERSLQSRCRTLISR
eukprot:gene39222-53025_t